MLLGMRCKTPDIHKKTNPTTPCVVSSPFATLLL
jgi:hypothetical protein